MTPEAATPARPALPGRATRGSGGLPDPEVLPEFYEGVPLRRALAWVVDVLLIFGMSLLALPFTLFTALFWFPVLMLGIGFLYRWATLAGRSATLGMRLFGIQIRDADGARLSGGTAFAHTAGYAVSVVTFPLQLVSMGAMVLTPKGQGLTDMVLGSSAIRRPDGPLHATDGTK